MARRGRCAAFGGGAGDRRHPAGVAGDRRAGQAARRMIDPVQHMTNAAMAVRLRQITDDLNAAVACGDMAGVARCDHALRSAVIALIGGASLAEDGAEGRLALLIDALGAVREAAALLSERARKAARNRGDLVYLKTDRGAGRAE